MDQHFEVRMFVPENDLRAACRCFADSFYPSLWPLIYEADESFIEDILLALHNLGDVSLTAVADGKARGLIIGFFTQKARKKLSKKLKNAAAFLKITFKGLCGRYHMSSLARSLMLRWSLGYLPFLFKHPVSESQIIFLGSQEAYRKGIGKVLVDAWIREMRRHGCSTTIVSTDSTLNYKFYERRGFTKVAEFPINSYRLLMPEKQIKGMIYSFHVGKK